MKVFEYTATKFDGTTVKGKKDAYDLADLRTKLRMENLYLKEAKELKIKKKSAFFSVSSRISNEKIVLFMRQLSILINAGVTLTDSIKTLYQQETHKTFKNILQEVQTDLMQGIMLSDSLAKHPKVFPPYMKNMIYVSEITGEISDILELLADYYESNHKTRTKAKKAMTYPAFLFGIVVLVFIFLVVFIVPQLDDLLKEFGGELPALTRVVVAISDFFRTQYLWIILGVLLFGLSMFLFLRTKTGKLTKDYLKLKLPILAGINKDLITTRFASSLAIMIRSGVSVMESIETTSQLMDNVYFEKLFVQVVDFVTKGQRIATSITTIDFFPAMFTEMVAVGEQTGELETVLNKVAEYYDDKLSNTIDAATAMLEPMLIVFAAGVVGVVIMAIFLPLMEVMGTIG